MTIVEQRAAARIAWRYARKAKARTALILFLIALPIAALVGTGIWIKTVLKSPEDNVARIMGSADLFLVYVPDISTAAKLG
jgi:putative ABC transport system permease protein